MPVVSAGVKLMFSHMCTPGGERGSEQPVSQEQQRRVFQCTYLYDPMMTAESVDFKHALPLFEDDSKRLSVNIDT